MLMLCYSGVRKGMQKYRDIGGWLDAEVKLIVKKFMERQENDQRDPAYF